MKVAGCLVHEERIGGGEKIIGQNNGRGVTDVRLRCSAAAAIRVLIQQIVAYAVVVIPARRAVAGGRNAVTPIGVEGILIYPMAVIVERFVRVHLKAQCAAGVVVEHVSANDPLLSRVLDAVIIIVPRGPQRADEAVPVEQVPLRRIVPYRRIADALAVVYLSDFL